MNGLREAVSAAIAGRKDALERVALDAELAGETLDMTLPADAAPTGSVHPVSQVMDELAEIFADLGFAVATGPEIEDDWYNFTALNIPETHPARAMHDTFYLAGEHERADGSPHPHQPRADPRDAGGGRQPAGPHHRARAAPIAATATRPTRRCSTRSRGW